MTAIDIALLVLLSAALSSVLTMLVLNWVDPLRSLTSRTRKIP